jgi:hypothetical protein
MGLAAFNRLRREQARRAELKAQAEQQTPPAEEEGSVSEVEELDKEALVDKAHELGIGPKSTLQRWGADRLKAEIAEAQVE